MKNNLKYEQLLINVGCSENYVYQEQQEIQSACFGHECFSIFAACCYLRATNGELVNENITVTSEANDNSRIAVHTCIMKIINEFLGLHPEMFTPLLKNSKVE